MLWLSCLPTASLFLLLLPCFPAQDGGGIEQSTDVISAWEGGSVSITCPVNDSQNQLGMYLKAIRQNLNVIYFSKEKPPSINPEFANHIEHSKEGENFRITLHRLQQSDSKIYLCSEIVKISDHHKHQHGKTTIVVVKAKTSRALEQSPLYANPEQGQSVSITCVLKSSPEDSELFLLRTHVQPGIVLSVTKLNVSRVSPAFGNHLEYSREGNRIVITLHNLQEKDSDNYVCAEGVKDSPLLSASGTMVLVQEVDQAHSQACEKSSWGLYALLVVVALLFCALVCCTLYHVDVKKYFQKKKPNVVYEDMSYNSRRSTLVRTSTYSRGE
ncbi:CD7 protein, partial [Chaetops frenatus]|nr:CD7 protein [Chaetops frenatus]